MEQKPVYTVQELATLLQVSDQTIYNQIAAGNIKSTRVGRLHRIHHEEVERVIREGIQPSDTTQTPQLVAA